MAEKNNKMHLHRLAKGGLLPGPAAGSFEVQTAELYPLGPEHFKLAQNPAILPTEVPCLTAERRNIVCRVSASEVS